jgi:hypothetical protein
MLACNNPNHPYNRCEVFTFNSVFVWSNGGTFNANVVLLDSLSGINGNLVIGLALIDQIMQITPGL